MGVQSRQMVEQSLVHAPHIATAQHRLSRIERRHEQKRVSDAQERCDALDHRLIRDRPVNPRGDLVAKRPGRAAAPQRPVAETGAKSKARAPEKEGLKRRGPGHGTCQRSAKNEVARVHRVLRDEQPRQFPQPADKIDRSEAYSGPMLLDDEGAIRRHGQSERVDCSHLVDVVRRRRIDRSLRRHLQWIIDKSFRQSLEFANVELAGGARCPQAPPSDLSEREDCSAPTPEFDRVRTGQAARPSCGEIQRAAPGAMADRSQMSSSSPSIGVKSFGADCAGIADFR